MLLALRWGRGRITDASELIPLDRPIITVNSSDGEGLETLRSELEVSGIGESTAVVAVATSERSEGRSDLALELADTFASAGISTVLVSADPTAPGQSRERGAAAFLAGTEPVLGAVPVATDLVWVPYGETPDEGVVVTSDNAGALLSAARLFARVVVVEVGPVQDDPSARLFAHAADALVLEVNRGRSKSAVVYDSAQTLRRANRAPMVVCFEVGPAPQARRAHRAGARCGRNHRPADRRASRPFVTRLLVIGLDGGTRTVTDRAGAGLAHLHALEAAGARAVLRSTVPPITSAAWASMFTGWSPGRHGMYDFRVLDTSRYTQLWGAGHSAGFGDEPRFVTSKRWRGSAFWDLLGPEPTVAVSAVPMTYPAWPVNGTMISGFPLPDYTRNHAYPPGAADGLPNLLEGGDEMAGMTDEDVAAHCAGLVERQSQVVRGWLEPDGPDVMVAVFQGTDFAQHRLWKYLDQPGHPLNEALLGLYRAIDTVIGEARERLGRGGDHRRRLGSRLRPAPTHGASHGRGASRRGDAGDVRPDPHIRSEATARADPPPSPQTAAVGRSIAIARRRLRWPGTTPEPQPSTGTGQRRTAIRSTHLRRESSSISVVARLQGASSLATSTSGYATR